MTLVQTKSTYFQNEDKSPSGRHYLLSKNLEVGINQYQELDQNAPTDFFRWTVDFIHDFYNLNDILLIFLSFVQEMSSYRTKQLTHDRTVKYKRPVFDPFNGVFHLRSLESTSRVQVANPLEFVRSAFKWRVRVLGEFLKIEADSEISWNFSWLTTDY